MDYEFKQIIITLMLVILAVLGIHSYGASMIVVYQNSMNPTLYDGDFLVTNKLVYLFKEPEPGDIIIMLKEEPTGIGITAVGKTLEDYIGSIQGKADRVRYVKRVVAVAGDIVSFQGGYLYINGERMEEDYIEGYTYANYGEYPLIVPEGEVYVLGDNRENSLDSRMFGTVPIKLIESKVVYLF